MAHKTAEQYRLLADLLGEEIPPTKALKMAGWSASQARKGWASVPRDVVAMLSEKKRKELVERGKLDKKYLEQLMIGRLVKNIEDGKDGGAQSTKILGSHREINAWIPDNQTGVIVLNCPQEVDMGEMLAELHKAETQP